MGSYCLHYPFVAHRCMLESIHSGWVMGKLVAPQRSLEVISNISLNTRNHKIQ